MARTRPPPLALLSLALCAFGAGMCPGLAHATAIDDFRQARAAYEDHDYPRAVQLLEDLLLPAPTFEDPLLLQESRKYLGAAYVFVDRRDAAEQQFTEYLRAEADLERARLDPSLFTADVLSLFDGVRRRLIAERQDTAATEAAAREARQARRREAMLELVSLAQIDEVEVQVDPGLPWVPFGVGQFNNGNEGLGLFFAISESVLMTTASVSLAAWIPLFDQYERARRHEPGVPQVDTGVLAGLQVLNWVSGGLLLSVGIAGLIEANASFRGTRTVRRRREVPPSILEELRLVIGPTRVGLEGRF